MYYAPSMFITGLQKDDEMNISSPTPNDRKMSTSVRSAFNTWLNLLDEQLGNGQPVTNAMILGVNRLHEMQMEMKGQLFDPRDFNHSTSEILILLRRRPDWDEKFLKGFRGVRF